MLKSDPNAGKGLREVEELEDRIEKLRLSFEQFFSGTNNIDPSDKKIAIQRLITRLNEMKVKNPRVRFRFQSMVGRFVSLNQYWTRTLRKLEEGTMTRGMFFRSSELQGKENKAYYGKDAPNLPKEGNSETPQNSSTGSRSKTANETPNNAANASGGMGEQKIDRIYSEYVAARKQNNDDNASVKKETLKKSLETQYDNLKRKYNTDNIDFKVVKKDGKVILRPVVKK